MSELRSAIVLAGGRGRRFGGPKLETPVDGLPLLHRALAAAAAVATEVIIVAARDSTPGLPACPVPIRVVHDRVPDAGPLAALAEGLAVAEGATAIVVGGDMPRLRPAVLEAMLDRVPAAGPAAVVLEAPPSAGGEATSEPPPRQSLPLAVPVSEARIAAAVVLAEGRRALQALIDQLGERRLPAAEWLPLDPAAETLLDVDMPADVARAERS